jgi:hypothetical protein
LRVIVAGTRHIYDYRPVMRAIKAAQLLPRPIHILELVCGMADGVDTTAYYFAKMARIPIKEFPAPWDDLEMPGARIVTRKDGSKYNANAGPIRNQWMADYADALIAIWDGRSTGTEDMITRMRRKTNLIHVYRI